MQYAPLADDLLISRHDSSYRGLSAFFQSAQFPAAITIGRAGRARGGAISALDAPGFDLFGCRLGCVIVVEGARLGFLDVLIDHDANHDVLVPAEAATDLDAITLAKHAMRLGVLPVDLDLAALACA